MEAIQTVAEDFEQKNGHFETATLPEKEVLGEIDHAKTAFLSYGVMLDYNRDASRLWDNMLELWNEDRRYFDPEYVIHMDVDVMQSTFARIGFRYPNRDAQAWYDNSQVLVDEFSGSWDILLLVSDYDAVKLVELIRENNIKYLQGKKLAPFYAKVIDANMHDLENVWKLDIPVDTHIRRLTQRFVGEELSDDEIRDFWHRYGERNDIDPMTVDTALWMIGNNWDDWGEEYVEGL